MKIRSLLLFLVLLVVIVLATINWSGFMVPTTLSLGITKIQIPLGLVMLGWLFFLAALFLAFTVYLQTSALLDARRHARELQTHRELAERAEASRFIELRGLLEAELKTQADLAAQARAALLVRLDQLERDLGLKLEQSENSLAAHIGQLEDRLERGGHRLAPDSPA